MTGRDVQLSPPRDDRRAVLWGVGGVGAAVVLHFANLAVTSNAATWARPVYLTAVAAGLVLLVYRWVPQLRLAVQVVVTVALIIRSVNLASAWLAGDLGTTAITGNALLVVTVSVALEFADRLWSRRQAIRG